MSCGIRSCERVGDAHEQGVEALLGEHLVEHVGEPPIRIDELGRLRQDGASSGMSRRCVVGRTTIRLKNHACREEWPPPTEGTVRVMPESAATYVPARPTLPKLREAAADCRGLPALGDRDADGLRRRAPRRRRRCSSASSPATRRTWQGRPFVGPAGRFLDEALELAGVDRARLRHERGEALQVGGARQAADPREADLVGADRACRPWLEAELAVVQPEVLVCLGATAAQSLLGKQFRVTKERGRWLESDLAPHVTATIHPSAILRQRDNESRQRNGRHVEDLARRDLALARSPTPTRTT